MTRHRRAPVAPRFTWCAALVVPLLMLWSVATPLMASVDEPAHVIWAAAAVRGEWRQPLITTSIGQEPEVRVPGGIARLDGIANCLPGDPDATADCVSSITETPSGSTTSITQFGRYPLPYYLAVGWPTLLLTGASAAYAVRLASAIQVGLMLALSLLLLWKYHPRRSTVLGWAVATTPAVLGLGGVVNSSSLKIASGLAAWCGLLALVQRDDAPPRLIGCTAFSIALFVLARPLSPLYVLITVALCGLLAGRSRLLELARSRAVWIGTVVVAVAGTAALAGRLVFGAPTLLGTESNLHGGAAVRQAASESAEHLLSLVGNFRGIHPPLMAVLVFTGLVAGLLVAATLLGSRREVITLALLVAVVLLMPIALEASQIPKIGPWWQARYVLPLAVAIPILAAGLIPAAQQRALGSSRAPVLVAALVAAAHFITFVWVLHRFTSGLNGSWLPLTINWEPPIPVWPLVGLAVAAYAALAWFLRGLAIELRRSRTTPLRRRPD